VREHHLSADQILEIFQACQLQQESFNEARLSQMNCPKKALCTKELFCSFHQHASE